MYFYSNDLSMNQGAVNIDAAATIMQFLKVCKSLLDYRFEKLVVNGGFLDTPIVDGITIRQHWNLNNKSDIARRLKSLNLQIVNGKERRLLLKVKGTVS